MANKPKFTIFSKGVSKEIIDFFKRKSKDVQLELKGSEKDYTPEDRMKLLAIQSYENKTQDTIRASLVQALSLKEEEHKKNPSKELAEEIELETKMLGVFDETIKTLKTQDTVAKEEEARKLYDAAKKREKNVNDLYQTFLADIKKLTKSLSSLNEPNVRIMAGTLDNHLKNIIPLRVKFLEAVKAYEDFSGIKYPNKAELLKLPNETVEELYELTVRLKEKSKDKTTIEKCDKLIEMYKHFMVKPDEYGSIREKVDQKLVDEKNADAKKTMTDIKEKLLEIEKKYLEKYKEQMSKFRNTQDLFRELREEIFDVIDTYPSLTEDERKELDLFVVDKINADISDTYKEMLEPINTVTAINEAIEQLSKEEYGTENFDKLYKKILEEIKLFKDSEMVSKLNIDVVFDEEKQMLHVMFRSELINDFSRAIVNEKVLAKMAEIKKGGTPKPKVEPKIVPQPNPGKGAGKGAGSGEGQNKGGLNPNPTPITKPEPKKDDIQEEELNQAISNYISLLKEINDQYKAINDCNRKMSAQAYVDLDKLDANTVVQLIDIENTAQNHDMNIMRTRLALSNARAELRTKYHCYVTSIKEVMEFPVLNVEFGNDYEMFIEEYDRLVVEAEVRIKKLSEEMNNEKTSPERKAELKTTIENLYNYIRTINKFIDRRIVHESSEKGLDIVTLLKARNEHRRKLREELEKTLQPIRREPIETPEQVQARLTQELEISLKDVYSRWLNAIELGIDINEELYINEINRIVNSSKLTGKEQVADAIKSEFLVKKEQCYIAKLNRELEAVKQEVDLMNITDDFMNTVIARYEQVKVKYEKVFEKFGMIYAPEENKIKVLINAEPPQIPGHSIETNIISEAKNQEYTEYLEKKNVQVTEEQILATARIIIGKDLTDDVKVVISVLQLMKTQSPEETMRILEILDERGVIKLTGDGKFERMIENFDDYRKQFHNANVIISPKVTTQDPGLVPEVRVNKPNSLRLRTDKPEIINRLNSKILTVDELGLRIIKNGFAIKYSESLRQELKALNAKLSLVQKGNGLRRRTSINFDENAEKQDLAFKSINEEFDAKDYRLEIRARQRDENGKLTNRSDLVYDLEMTDELLRQIPEEKVKSL